MAEKKNVVNSFSFSIEMFDSKSSVWSNWIIRLECQFLIHAIKDDRKLAYLYSYMGPDAFAILCSKLLPKKPMDSGVSYDEVVELMKKHYEPQSLQIFEIYKFHQLIQDEGETIANFVGRLRKQAEKCEFETYVEKAIRDRMVLGIKDGKIQQKLLESDNLTLSKAIQIAEAMETVLKGKDELKPAEVHAIDKQAARSPGESTTRCYRCGNPNHLANKCKFKDQTCNNCKRMGHIARVCKNNDKTNKHVSNVVSLNFVDKANDFEKYSLKLFVNEVEVCFEIDSGCPVTIINHKLKDKFFSKVPLYETKKRFKSYCGKLLDVLGIIRVKVRINNITKELPMYVAYSDRSPLLGREWLSKLKLDWNKIIYDCNLVNEASVRFPTKESLFKKFPKVFEKSIGCIDGLKAKLVLKDDVKPVFIKARTIPFSLRDPVEKELNHLVSQGILEKVDFSEWATPIVPVKKPNNKVRICGDYKITLNPRLLIPEYPLPTIEELFADMAGGKKFTKIDLTQAYLQLSVNEENCELLTLNTHIGLFRPSRLMYGVASAPAIFQKTIEKILEGIPNVKVFLDDIKVTGKTEIEHVRNVEEVLRRLDRYNLRVNEDKCVFFADKIDYCGYIIDEGGISKIKENVDAISLMPAPKNQDEVRSLLGLVNYYGRFIPNLSRMVYPITNLLKAGQEFVWSRACQKAFDQLKEELTSDRVLVHYDPSLPLVLATDASNAAVGAVLSHIMPDGTERPIRYASQTLSQTQQRYAMVDKEAYAIIFGVKKFYQYLYNRKFILYCDNKAVTQIFSETKGLPVLSATRMQHYAIFLQAFDYEIKYRKSEENSNADGLSRLSIISKENADECDEIDVLEIESIETLPVTVKIVAAETKKDQTVKRLMRSLEQGKICDKKDRFSVNQEEFTLQQGCLMRNSRVYIPRSLRSEIMRELHAAHFGISRMKSLARTYCWWSGMDNDIENLVKNCPNCQLNRHNPPKVETHLWQKAKKPFERVHIDFAGPLQDGSYFLIIVDAFSKWMEVEIMRSTTTTCTIERLRRYFSTYGIPLYLVSDNGPQFTSEEFSRFLVDNGIFHKRSAPYHPATNGQAERSIQTIKQKIKAIRYRSVSELEKCLRQILMQYRITKHASTEKTPAELVFGRQMRSLFDLMVPNENECESVSEPMKEVRSLVTNQRVSARNYTAGGEKWKFGKIERKLGRLHYLIRMDDGNVWKRHIDQIRPIGSECRVETNQPNAHYTVNSHPRLVHTYVQENMEPEENNEEDLDNSVGDYESCDSEQDIPQPHIENPQINRPVRNRQLPVRLNDYDLSN